MRNNVPRESDGANNNPRLDASEQANANATPSFDRPSIFPLEVALIPVSGSYVSVQSLVHWMAEQSLILDLIYNQAIQNPPTWWTHPKRSVEHAGDIGRIAGARGILNQLAEHLAPHIPADEKADATVDYS